MPTITIEVKVDGAPVAITAMNPKEFKSGSRGYWGQVRPTVEGRRYIANIQLVEIGSKSASDAPVATEASTTPAKKAAHRTK